jgi:hypothetical protein
MKSLHLGLAMRLFVATVSPACGAPLSIEGVPHPILHSTMPVSSVQPWRSGSETATLPWSAPLGHHQPRLADIPASSASTPQDLNEEDARIDRIIRNICRNC